jgi:hypothetical protein
MKTTKKNTDSLVVDTNNVGLEVNGGRTKHILVFHNQNAGQSHNTKTANGAFENMAKFKYL